MKIDNSKKKTQKRGVKAKKKDANSEFINDYINTGRSSQSNKKEEENYTNGDTIMRKHYEQVSKKDISNMNKQEFYISDYDPYDDEFGLHPMLYKMFSKLNVEDDFIEKQNLSKEGRKIFNHKKPVNYKTEDLEEIDKKYATSYLREARGKEFGER